MRNDLDSSELTSFNISVTNNTEDYYSISVGNNDYENGSIMSDYDIKEGSNLQVIETQQEIVPKTRVICKANNLQFNLEIDGYIIDRKIFENGIYELTNLRCKSIKFKKKKKIKDKDLYYPSLANIEYCYVNVELRGDLSEGNIEWNPNKLEGILNGYKITKVKFGNFGNCKSDVDRRVNFKYKETSEFDEKHSYEENVYYNNHTEFDHDEYFDQRESDGNNNSDHIVYQNSLSFENNTLNYNDKLRLISFVGAFCGLMIAYFFEIKDQNLFSINVALVCLVSITTGALVSHLAYQIYNYYYLDSPMLECSK